MEKWQAAHRWEPWGDEWTRTSRTMSAVLAPYTKRTEDTDRFIPRSRALKRQTDEEMWEMLTGNLPGIGVA